MSTTSSSDDPRPGPVIGSLLKGDPLTDSDRTVQGPASKSSAQAGASWPKGPAPVISSPAGNAGKSRKSPPVLPPVLPAKPVVVYDCVTRATYQLTEKPLKFGSSDDSHVRLRASSRNPGMVSLSRVGHQLRLHAEMGQLLLEVNGVAFSDGFLPDGTKDSWSLSINRSNFFFITIGYDAIEWGEQLKNFSPNCWRVHRFDGVGSYERWCKDPSAEVPEMSTHERLDFAELLADAENRFKGSRHCVIYHQLGRSPGFFLNQFTAIGNDVIPDEGELRCHRCWLRFTAGNILAIHPSDYGDLVLGESELKRFTPTGFDSSGRPLTTDGRPCVRLACPHCRGELPPGFIQKAPHLISLVGDSMAGKSYFLAAVVKQLLGRLRREFGVNFTDGDPVGNGALSKMVAKLFSPSDDPKHLLIEKTELAGATYKEFFRHGKLVSLPAPFTYKIDRPGRSSASVILYDNAGEHFRPGQSETEKSNFTEHIAWASGIVFLFDPLQHEGLLRRIEKGSDPQVSRMCRNAPGLNFDQNVILSEMATRLRAWRGAGFDESFDFPLAVVLGKHDLLGEVFPESGLTMDVCREGSLSLDVIEANSRATCDFLLEFCPDIVAAAETVSTNVRYFPASSFGSPAIELSGVRGDSGDAMIGPNPQRRGSYLVEAPFYWLLSQFEPELIPTISSNLR